MSGITLTPEIVAMISNIIVMVGGFLKLENRLTKLETTLALITNGQIDIKKPPI